MERHLFNDRPRRGASLFKIAQWSEKKMVPSLDAALQLASIEVHASETAVERA